MKDVLASPALDTGAVPRGESMAELMYKIASEDAGDIRTVRKKLPASLAAMVAVSLCKRPGERHQTEGQFAAELRQVFAGLTAIPGAGTRLQQVPTPVAAPHAYFDKTSFHPKSPSITPVMGTDIEI